jgi:NADPH2:quinone reductase
MKAIIYTQRGGTDVLTLVERPLPKPAPGEVRVRVRISGVNPTDWKVRQGLTATGEPAGEQVPNQDGAGVIDAVGQGVDPVRIGERVWLWLAAHNRPHGGTAQEYVVLPQRHAVPLPDNAPYELGAALGVPALTAHRCLTVAEGGPTRLAPGALTGHAVLVAGGAGAVGNAAIQLARWAGATVVATVSGPRKAALAKAAGAHHVVNYRDQDAAQQIRTLVPGGIGIIVEVSLAVNAALDLAIAAPHAVVAFYAINGGDSVTFPIRAAMMPNLRWQGVMLYGVPAEALTHAVTDVSAALTDGALRVGEEAGLPLHRYSLDKTADAHAAVEANAVGKVLIDVPAA